jgi:hypothetical protein
MNKLDEEIDAVADEMYSLHPVKAPRRITDGAATFAKTNSKRRHKAGKRSPPAQKERKQK